MFGCDLTRRAKVWKFGRMSWWRSVFHQETHRRPSPGNRRDTLSPPIGNNREAERTNQKTEFVPSPRVRRASSAASSPGDSKPLPCCHKLLSTGSGRRWLQSKEETVFKHFLKKKWENNKDFIQLWYVCKMTKIHKNAEETNYKLLKFWA